MLLMNLLNGLSENVRKPLDEREEGKKDGWTDKRTAGLQVPFF